LVRRPLKVCRCAADRSVHSSRFSDMQIHILNGELTMIVPEADRPWESRNARLRVPGQFVSGSQRSGTAHRFQP
jgi:hypothetical protein